MESRSIAEVVGANLKEMRAHYDITLADLSRWLRVVFGLNWSTGRLADVESGRGSATVQLLTVLAVAMSDMTEQEIKPADFLHSNAPVVLGPKMILKGPSMIPLFEGDKVEIDPEDIHDFAKRERASLQALDQFLRSAEDQWSLSDERAAKKLELSKEEFTQRCLKRWTRILSAEVNHRTSPGDSPQKKGRITRSLMEELREP